MAASGEKLPFDIANVRTIYFDLKNPDEIERTKATLTRQVEEIQSGHIPDSPVSMVLSEQLFSQNQNAVQVFLEKLWSIEDGIERIHQNVESIENNVANMENDISSIEFEVESISKKID